MSSCAAIRGDVGEHRRVKPAQHHVLELACGAVDVHGAFVDADGRIYVDKTVKPLSEIVRTFLFEVVEGSAKNTVVWKWHMEAP
jgi:hypothetical protein